MSSTELSTRDRILEATWHLMAERRGQGVKIEEIAQAAKVSRQAVYLHFKSRAELLTATTHYVDETLQLGQRLMEICQGRTGTISLEEFTDVWCNYIPEIYGLAKALLDSRDTDEAAAAAWDDRMKALSDACQTIIRDLAENHRLADGWSVDEAADFAWAMLSVRNWESLTLERGWTQAQYVTRIQYLLRQTLVKSG